MATDRLTQPWGLPLQPTSLAKLGVIPAAGSKARLRQKGPGVPSDASWLGSRRTRGYYLSAMQKGC